MKVNQDSLPNWIHSVVSTNLANTIIANAGIRTPTKGMKNEGRHDAAKSALHELGNPYILSIMKRCIFLLVIFISTIPLDDILTEHTLMRE